MHVKDTLPGGAAADAEVVRDAAARLSRAADHARHGTGDPPDFAEIDLLLAKGLGSLLLRHRGALIKNLALRAAKVHGAYGRLLCGETGTDVMSLAMELNAIRQAIMILRAGDDRSATLASRSAPAETAAHPVQ
jgi:hypothetical protein